ncbi:RNA helicase, partial [Teratosphaeriaceae sp. CCFEE 6253]
RLHKGIVAYLWLSYRFAGIFSTRGMAFHVKEMVEERIETVLGKFSFSEVERRKKAAGREKGIKLALEQAAQAAAAEDEDVEGERAGDGSAVGLVREGQEGAEVDGRAGVTLREDGGEQEGSMIAGGDRFAGEEDVVLEEPSPAAEPFVEGQEAKAEAHETEKEAPATSKFAQWRALETRGESQGSGEEVDEVVGVDERRAETEVDVDVHESEQDEAPERPREAGAGTG